MRLIDADSAKRTYTQDMFDTEEDFERVNDVLDYAPTVDAVVVTRCKDCKYGSYDSKPNGAMVCLRTNGRGTAPSGRYSSRFIWRVCRTG